jgi:AcrR family transcriptional regulator
MKNNAEKQRILNLVNELFYRNGLYKTSMDEIASELKISKKTIYKYFDSKYDLVKETTLNMLNESGRRVEKILEGNEDLAKKLIHLMEDYSNEVCTVSEKWIKDMRTHYPEIWKGIEEYRNEKIYAISKKLIKMGVKEKIIINYPPELLVESYAATIRAIVNPAFLLQCKCTMQEAIDFVFNIHLNGILTPKGRLKYNEGKKKIKKK